MVDAKDILPLIPAAFSTARELIGLLPDNQRAAAAVSFSEKITTFVIDATEKGLSPELFIEGIEHLVTELKADLFYGVR